MIYGFATRGTGMDDFEGEGGQVDFSLIPSKIYLGV